MYFFSIYLLLISLLTLNYKLLANLTGHEKKIRKPILDEELFTIYRLVLFLNKIIVKITIIT